MSNVSRQILQMRITHVSPQHHESLVDLLCEMHAFYNEGTTPSRTAVQDHLRRNLLSATSPVRLVVATTDGRDMLGFAATALFHSLVEFEPAKSGQCLVKELYVRSSARSQGVGKAIMVWVAQYAADNGCSRIDWNVKASNHAGLRFYERLGAERVTDRLSYRLSGKALEQLAHYRTGSRLDG